MTFDASTPGTSRADWEADPRLGAVPSLDLRGFGAVVVLAAHPDDETLGAGSTMARAAREGCEVTVVCVTDGGGSEQGPARRDVVREREGELIRALDRLGILRPPAFFGFADGSVREERDPVARRLDELLAQQADDTLVIAPWTGDGHRDHRVLGEVAVVAAERAGLPLWQYPVWLWHWGTPDHPDVPWSRLRRVSADEDQQNARTQALAAFESQLTGEPPMLQARFLEHFDRECDYFVV